MGLVLLFALVATAAATAAPTTVPTAAPTFTNCTHLLIVDGQSNADGGHGQPILAIDLAADPRVWEANYTSGSPIPGYEPFQGRGVPIDTTNAGPYQAGAFFGPGISFKGTMGRLYADSGRAGTCRVLIVNCAFPGTGFYTDSDNCPALSGNATSRTWRRGGSCRQEAANRIARVLANPANGLVTVVAVLRHQLEFEVGRTFNNVTYYNLQYIDDIRNLNGPEYGYPGVTNTTPIVFGGMMPLYDYEVHGMAVTHAIAQLKYKRPLIGYASTVGEFRRNIHGTEQTDRTWGHRFYAEAVRLLDARDGPTGAPTPAPTPATPPACYNASLHVGVPAGTRAYYPLDGHVSDCGPLGLPDLVTEAGFDQTLQFDAPPFPWNDSLAYHPGAQGSGTNAVLVYDANRWDRLRPRFLYSSRTDLMPLAHVTINESLILASHRAALLDYNDSLVTDPYYFQDQGPGHTVSAWFYWAGAGGSCVSPFHAISSTGFNRGFPGYYANAWRNFAWGDLMSGGPVPFRRWAHVAAGVRNMTGYAWIDGVQYLNLTTGYQYDERNGWLTVGRTRTVDQPSVVQCDGDVYVRALRVYDRLLTPAEVAQLYAAESVNGSMVPDTLYVARAQTQSGPSPWRWTFANNSLNETSGAGPALDARPAIGANGVYCGSPRAGAAQFAATPLARGVIRDRVFKQVRYTTTSCNQATSSFLALPEPGFRWSVCAAFYYQDMPTATDKFGFESDSRTGTGAGSSFYSPYLQTTDANVTWRYTGDSSAASWTVAAIPGTWHHLCITMNYANSSRYGVYYNGALKLSGSRGANATYRPAQLSLPVDSDAYIAQVAFWDTDIDAAAVADEYNYVMFNITEPPTPAPTLAPTRAPTTVPTAGPTVPPGAPSSVPTAGPTAGPTPSPTMTTGMLRCGRGWEWCPCLPPFVRCSWR